MNMDPVRYLKPEEVVQAHPFSDPAHIHGDLNSLRYLVHQLCMFVELPHLYAGQPRPVTLHRPDTDKWTYRLVVTEPERLLSSQELTFVGFLGQRRADADVALATEFDSILVSEIPEHPDLLCYSTLALISGDYSNLVVFANEEAKSHWGRSQAHAQAVGRLAPDYYLSVRLYNGLLPHGLADSQAMNLTRVKYFDYQTTPWWQAVREYPAGQNGQT